MVPNSTDDDDAQSSLSNPVLLDKVDELRQLNIASMVPLPQVRYAHSLVRMYVSNV